MSATLDLPGFAQPEPVAIDTDRKAEFQIHCTPPAVAEQCLRAVLSGWTRFRPGPMPILDLCAGYGVWSQVMRRLAAEMQFLVHITGLEIREECRADLERHCDEVVIDDAAELADHHPWETLPASQFDLIMGNPPFSFPDKRAPREQVRLGVFQTGRSRLRAFEVLVVAGRRLLADQDSRLALFLPSDWTRRGEGPAELAQDHPRILVLEQALPIAFAPGSGTDSRAYGMSVWGHPSAPAVPCELITLPLLTSAQRHWDGDTIPGTESP